MKLFDVVVATRFLNDDPGIQKRLFNSSVTNSRTELNIIKAYNKKIDYVFDCFTYGCIDDNFIQKVCQLNKGKYPDSIFIAGVGIDCSILSIAAGLSDKHIRPLVLTKYCASSSGFDSYYAGFTCLRSLIGEEQIVNLNISEYTNFVHILGTY